jgi:hypothetical protein
LALLLPTLSKVGQQSKSTKPWGLLLGATLCLLWVRPVFAIPVFARVYDKPCSACHTTFPQLNPAGEDFRARGLHGFTPVIKPIKVGSAFELPGTLPLALAFGVGEDLSKVDTPGKENPTRTHLNFEFLSLFSGGELGPHLAYLVDYAPVITNPQTGEISINTRLGLGFLQAHQEWGRWLLNLKAGLFELPLAASPRVHRLSVQPYLTYSLNAYSLLGRPPPTRGARKDTLNLSATQIGVELNGLDPEGGFGWSIGATNGSNNRWDNNASKDFYFRLSQAYGFHKAGLFLYYRPHSVYSAPPSVWTIPRRVRFQSNRLRSGSLVLRRIS